MVHMTLECMQGPSSHQLCYNEGVQVSHNNDGHEFQGEVSTSTQQVIIIQGTCSLIQTKRLRRTVKSEYR
jgi:hypothetical protein